VSSCELVYEPSGSIKCWESTEWLHNLWPLEWYSAPQLVSVCFKGLRKSSDQQIIVQMPLWAWASPVKFIVEQQAQEFVLLSPVHDHSAITPYLSIMAS
jgi:hypothetical protein